MLGNVDTSILLGIAEAVKKLNVSAAKEYHTARVEMRQVRTGQAPGEYQANIQGGKEWAKNQASASDGKWR